MLRKFGVLVMLVVLGLGAVGIAQEDGSAPYPSPEKVGEIGEPSPQFVWRGCCSPIWQNSPWSVIYEGVLEMATWRCPLTRFRGYFYVRLEEAEFCCYMGWKVFGFCVSRDDTPTCWKKVRRTFYFIGCV